SHLTRNVSTVPIATAVHPQTNITQVIPPSHASPGAYFIVASSPISQVSYMILEDNRVVVDIHNAITQVSGNLAVHGSVPVGAARIAQFSSAPAITRVVLEVTHAADFTLALSADRKTLSISFMTNNIRSVSFATNGVSDTLSIQGDILPNISISTEAFPNYLVINIDNANMLASGHSNIGGAFATHFETGESPDGSAFIRVYVGENWPTFSVSTHGNTTTLTLNRGVTGLWYDSLRRELHIAKSTGFTMNINQVQHINEYLQLRYSLVLPGTASVLGLGEVGVMDGLINNITLQQDAAGHTRIVFDTARILGFTVHETADSYIIRAHMPRDLHPFIVVIDPGHGGTAPGTSHHGVVEAQVALQISHMVRQLFADNPNVQIYMTRHEDVNVRNQWRAEFANDLEADLFISVHANAAGTNANPNPVPHGIETWYNFGELERNSNNHFVSRDFAAIVQRHKLARTGANDRGLRYGPGLIVLRESNMPAVLLEVGFITNPAEAARLATAAHQSILAQAIHDAIIEATNTFPRP
ncbi:MAG: N-acetylmuramoyl-L-alanine amidase, partial [Defluviitaleaceae bacterium]|nr:N-acetylmuramoyl-L-alanine amidase [Defluviitaleaceae bacterium]